MMFIIAWWKEILGASLIIVIVGLFYFISIQKNTILKKETKILELTNTIKTLNDVILSDGKTIHSLNLEIISLKGILSGNDEISSGTITDLKKIIKELKSKKPQGRTVTIYRDCNITEVPQTSQEIPNDFIKISIENIGKL